MSPTAVTCVNAGDGVLPLPIVLFTLTTLARLNRLNPSSISSSLVPPSAIDRATRMSNVAVAHDRVRSSKHGSRPELRPTPAGRSFTVVSLLLSARVTTLSGGGEEYEKPQQIETRASARRTASLEPSPNVPLTTSRCR